MPLAYSDRHLKGLNGGSARVSAYDPLNDREVAVTVNSMSDDTVSVTIDAADYPYLLVVDDGAKS